MPFDSSRGDPVLHQDEARLDELVSVPAYPDDEVLLPEVATFPWAINVRVDPNPDGPAADVA